MRHLLLCSASVALSLSVPAASQTMFGSFGDNPQGEFILQEPRPLFQLTRDFVFRDEAGIEWIAPKGESIDGASIPKPAWSFIGGPFEGAYLYASIIHDYYSCAKTRDFEETQDIFWRGLRASGVSASKAWYMWAAVRFLGLPRWKVDSAYTPPVPCRSAAPVPTVFDVLNDQQKKTALAKLTVIQKTLETSNGLVLDVVGSEVVPTGSAEADRHMELLADAAASGFQRSTTDLGYLVAPSEAEIADPGLVTPWAIGDVPALDAYLAAENITPDYAAEAQPKFDMSQIDAVLDRLDTVNIEAIYELRMR